VIVDGASQIVIFTHISVLLLWKFYLELYLSYRMQAQVQLHPKWEPAYQAKGKSRQGAAICVPRDGPDKKAKTPPSSALNLSHQTLEARLAWGFAAIEANASSRIFNITALRLLPIPEREAILHEACDRFRQGVSLSGTGASGLREIAF
jgi:hypothetical protein